MKQFLLILSFLCFQFTIAQDNIEVSRNLNNNQKLKHLPSKVKDYIINKYPNDSIIKAGYKQVLWTKTYEVHYNYWIIQFDEDGNWIKNFTSDGIAKVDELPEPIMKILKKNYPKQKIVRLEQNKDNLYIYLDNNKNLSFKNPLN